MTKAKKDGIKLLGFLATSTTASARMAMFPISPGFDKTSAEADLQVCLARQGGNWKGYSVSHDGNKTHFRVVRAKA